MQGCEACRLLERLGAWTGHVHFCSPPLAELVVPRSVRDWDNWKVTDGPDYQPPMDASEGEEEDLETDFPEYTDPPPLD